MPSSIQVPKFLLDENVRRDLYTFLNQNGFDVLYVPSGASDIEVAALSHMQQRVLVTNDADFLVYRKNRIFSLIWLRVPQKEALLLCETFSNLLASSISFEGSLIMLFPETWQIKPLHDE